jgi:hypothetical protein
MLKINFFTHESLHLLESALSLLNDNKLSTAARNLFGDVVAIDYSADMNRVLIHDNMGNTIAKGIDDTLDLWVDTLRGDGTLTNLVKSAIREKDALLAEELWDKYATYLPLGLKVEMLKVLGSYVVTDSFHEYKPFMDYENQVYSNRIIYRNCYDNCMLSNSTFRNSHLTNCSFRFAHLDGVDFSQCVLENCDFTGAVISETTNFKNSYLVGSRMPQLPQI